MSLSKILFPLRDQSSLPLFLTTTALCTVVLAAELIALHWSGLGVLSQQVGQLCSPTRLFSS
jgi:hypothetical protein